jgi:hypothetical protein
VTHAKAFLLLWRHAAARALLGRRGIGLLLLAVLPAGLAWLLVTYDARVSTNSFVATMLILAFQFVLPFAGIFLGVAVMGDEIEGRTITYLFTRPMSRPLVFLARYLGHGAAFSAFLFATLALTALVFRTRVALPVREAAASAGLGVLGFLVYAAFFAALRTVVRRALFVGFILAFILEGFVSKLPRSGISGCSVWHHLALLQMRLFPASVGSGEIGDLTAGIGPEETVASSLWVLGSILVASLVAGALNVQARETRLANAST